jgi:hypothetical protein
MVIHPPAMAENQAFVGIASPTVISRRSPKPIGKGDELSPTGTKCAQNEL